MTALGDDQVERYSRQIIMPEVGGRGQERLLAARVAIAGDGEAAAIAAMLLARAGIGALDLIGACAAPADGSPDCTVRRLAAGTTPTAAVIVDFASDAALARAAARAGQPYVRATLDGAGGAVLTLVGRPCALCVPGEEPCAAQADALAAPAALAIGALAANEALRVLLAPPDEGRAHRLDLAAGVATSRPLLPTGGCPVCGGTA